MRKKKNKSLKAIPGQKFNKLTVIAEAGKAGIQRLWLCRCDCGFEKVLQAGHVRYGQIKSCGNCRRVKGHSQTPEYRAWRDAQNRCTNPKHPAWKYYGGRGIAFCSNWTNNFAQFLKDIGPRPDPKLTLERVNNESGYSKDNCKWASRKEQAHNQRPRFRKPKPIDFQI